MSKKNKNEVRNNSGIIALFPAIIISSLLIILCVSVSQSFLAFLYRVTIFDQKNQSEILADVCVLRVRSKYLQDSNYRGGEEIVMNEGRCTIGNISTTTTQISLIFGSAISVRNVEL